MVELLMSVPTLSRRSLIRSGVEALTLAGVGTSCASAGRRAGQRQGEWTDCHTHFWDPNRPGGITWPAPDDSRLYRPFLPQDYLVQATPLGIGGVLVVEASAVVEDNQWVLELADQHPFILGYIGHLRLGDPDYPARLQRFARYRCFRGLRISEPGLQQALQGGAAWRDLVHLTDLGLIMEAHVHPDGLPLVIRLADRLPSLSIVIDHAAYVPIQGGPVPGSWALLMAQAGERRQVACKLSRLMESAGEAHVTPLTELAPYRPVLDHLFAAFGDDRLMFGSNWPVCGSAGTLQQVVGIVDGYLETRDAEVRHKIFAGNCRRIYRL